ncbi:MAG: arylsulfatase A [Rhodothermales bacterium]|jgi:arylsulfatase A
MQRLSAAAIAVFILAGCAAQPDQTPPPNVVMIMIDDLGWTDLHVQGNPLLETPVIDQLAREGMRFTDAYAASPVCSPTRAAVITGLSPARLAITNHITGDQAQFQPPGARLRAAEMNNHLELDYVTLAERLDGAGYANGFFGKWHLSGTKDEMTSTEPGRRPEHQGFDVNVGGVSFGGPPSFFDPYQNPAIADRQEGEYLPFRLADETDAFIREHQGEPFFVALWPYTVHWPMEAPAELIAKYADRPGFRDLGDGLEAATAYAAMIEAMDDMVGRVLGTLDELGLADNTMVIFTSDNGAYGGVSDMTPLRAAKGHLYEGGIRVPLIVRWPGQIQEGTLDATPVISMDLAPTILEATAVTYQDSEFDGESLLPVLQGAGTLDREAIFFHYPNYAFHGENRLGGAVRSGPFKLIEWFDDGSTELYDLSVDISEANDLSQTMPDRARELQALLHAWLDDQGAQMPTPVVD